MQVKLWLPHNATQPDYHWTKIITGRLCSFDQLVENNDSKFLTSGLICSQTRLDCSWSQLQIWTDYDNEMFTV